MPDYKKYVWDPDTARWVYIGSDASASIYYDTTHNWNLQRDFVSERLAFYVYTDHEALEDEYGNVTYAPGLKIGDGTSYLIDLPFVASSLTQIEETLNEHINDMVRHITSEERDSWNNKAHITPTLQNETLVFTLE